MANPSLYRKSGVNIAIGDSFAASLQAKTNAEAARLLAERGGELQKGVGGFAAAVRLPGKNAPTLAACADGVGTKVRLLAEHNRPRVAGVDVVAMCVNDLICAAARPLFFLDYYACDSLSPDVAAEVLDGIADGCRQAGCALVGGETAEMPGVYAKDNFDVAGFAVGIAEPNFVFAAPKKGDAILAVASSGPHSNGYSLIRKIVADTKPPKDILESLLSPTVIYCDAVAALQEKLTLRGLAHITGGGLPGNLPRALPSGLSAKVNISRPRLPVFAWLQQNGEVSEDEMRRVFNDGVGLAIVVAENDVDEAIAILKERGEDAWRLGEVVADESSDSDLESARVIYESR